MTNSRKRRLFAALLVIGGAMATAAHAQEARGYGDTKSAARNNAIAEARAACKRKNDDWYPKQTGEMRYGQYPNNKWEAVYPYICTSS